MDTPLISLIIPVYKAKDYIASCVIAIQAQTMDEIEAIFVDDCDPDGSVEIAKQMIESYGGNIRFKFVKAERNGGPGAARNLGMKAAKGKYVAFIDCDDIIAPNYCSSLCDAAECFKADLVCCDAYMGEFGKPSSHSLRGPSFNPGILKVDVRKRILRTFVTYLWTYLFRLDFIKENGIEFPCERSAEDSCFVTCAWLTAKSAVHIEEALYQYIVRNTSVSKVRDRKRAKSRLASFRQLKTYAKAHGLTKTYGREICLLRLKKGYLTALKDTIVNI